MTAAPLVPIPAQLEVEDLSAEHQDYFESCIICGDVPDSGAFCHPCGIEAAWWYL